MTTLHSWERPFKVWSHDREQRKSVIATSLVDLKLRAAEKLGYGICDPSSVKIVLESDGTEIEEEAYFQTSEKDTTFLLLKNNEKWLPGGVEALKAAITAIPDIVCEALNKMELIDKPPSWKIMDNRGNVTVVLHWDHRDRGLLSHVGKAEPTWRLEVTSKPTDQKGAQTGVKTVTPSSIASPASVPLRAKLTLDGLKPRLSTRTLPFARDLTSSPKLIAYDDDESDEDRENGDINHTHDHSQCDFHCAALHREGTQIQVNKSIATSPIQEMPTVITSTSEVSTGAIPKKTGAKGHVRFMDVEIKKISSVDGSDSETETTEKEEEQLCEKYLLLVDQLSVNQDNHLTLKDIGIILERLNSKIIDVDKLEREKESVDCHNWIIKATVRGEIAREIGVVYNGQYYGITEHPGYF
ncbi:uncharacterized protein B4U80_02344 [Leptotrombidium deliense]|uniref:CIDE-N domain-containing protein n=1 Tax=Leptotrombidium deliense TaxID=299467 RepID=A0A443SKR1_9ACAR|nr:uncharacterized protein B4U80_02344 [Leptotrombidium deliense]